MSKQALELKPVDPKLLTIVDRMTGTITGREFFIALFRSLVIRWKLRKNILPESLPYKEITDYECGGCGWMVNPNVHGDCPQCFSPNLFYIGHDAVLPNMEKPRSTVWAKRHDRTSQVAHD